MRILLLSGNTADTNSQRTSNLPATNSMPSSFLTALCRKPDSSQTSLKVRKDFKHFWTENQSQQRKKGDPTFSSETSDMERFSFFQNACFMHVLC